MPAQGSPSGYWPGPGPNVAPGYGQPAPAWPAPQPPAANPYAAGGPGWYAPPPGGGPVARNPYPGYAQTRLPTNGFAIASMVLGILWLWWLGSLLAVVFGHVALRQIRSSGEGGRGMAIAGLVLGYIGLLVAAVATVVFVAAASVSPGAA